MSQLSKLRAYKKGVRVQCHNPACQHSWEYKGNMLYGCCPSCRNNVNIERGKIKFAESQTAVKNTDQEQ